MFPYDSSIDLTIKKVLASCHKETQTSSASIKDSGTATGSQNVDTCDKGSLKVFEFSELVQDTKHPREITIIKDVFAEEIFDHNSGSGTPSEDAIANRYTYCREVIKPYLKDYPKDCPVSDDQLIRDALDAAHEDFPDYEPCFEEYNPNPKPSADPDTGPGTKPGTKPGTEPGKKPGTGGRSPLDRDSILNFFGIKIGEDDTENKDLSIKDNASSSSSLSKKDKATSHCSSTCVKKEIETPSKRKLTTCKSSISNCSNTFKLNMDKDQPDPNEKEKNDCAPSGKKVRDHRCPKKSHCPPSLEPCFDEKNPPGPPEACKNPSQEAMSTRCRNTPSAGSVDGSCEETGKPAKKKACDAKRMDMKEASRKSVFERTPSVAAASEERKKTMMEAHSETIATIKTAVEDFFGKVYQTTKDAVTVIKTESARHLGRITAKKSSSSDLIPQRVHEDKSSETITSFSYFRSTDNPDLQNKGTENDEGDETLKKAGQAIGKIFATVDSTLSMLSDQINVEKVSSLLRFEHKDRSSIYDNVKTNESEEPVPTSTSLTNSVFTAIKTKIVSMFGEPESETKDLSKKSEDTLSSKSEESIKSSKKRF